jgi:hypothetical protein
MDGAIDSSIEPDTTATDTEEDEYERWKRSETRAAKGTDPIKYWVTLCDRYRNLSKLEIDVLSIPASNCECERMFSELGDLLEPRRRGMKPQLLAAIQCVRRWQKASPWRRQGATKAARTRKEIELTYGVSTWDDETQH